MRIFTNFVALFGVSVGVGNRKGGFVTRIIPAIKMIAEKIRENKKYIKFEIMNTSISNVGKIIYQIYF